MQAKTSATTGSKWEEDSPLLFTAPHTITLLESHGDCVRKLPPHSKLLAYSRSAPVEIYTVHDHILGIQGHPDISKKDVAELMLPEFRGKGRVSEAEAAQCLKSLEQPVSTRRFSELLRVWFRQGLAA